MNGVVGGREGIYWSEEVKYVRDWKVLVGYGKNVRKLIFPIIDTELHKNVKISRNVESFAIIL